MYDIFLAVEAPTALAFGIAGAMSVVLFSFLIALATEPKI
jgi:hypothetical protein